MRKIKQNQVITNDAADWQEVHRYWQKFWEAWSHVSRVSVRRSLETKEAKQAEGNMMGTLIALLSDKNKLSQNPQWISLSTARQPKPRLVELIPHLHQIMQRLNAKPRQGNNRTVSPETIHTLATAVIEHAPASSKLIQTVIEIGKAYPPVSKVIFKPKGVGQKITDTFFPSKKVGYWSEVANGNELVTLLLHRRIGRPLSRY